MGKGLKEGFLEITPHLKQFSEQFYKFAFSYSGFILCLIGIYFIIKNKDKIFSLLILLLTFSFGVFILKSGYNFVHHSYYIIPFVPVMALLAAYGLSKLQNAKILVILLFIFSIDNFFRHQHDLRIPKRDLYRIGLEEKISPVIPQLELIATNGGASPVDMYNWGKRGYSLTNEELTPVNFDLLKKRGIRFFVFNKHGSDLRFNYKNILENEDVIIYKLDEKI